MGHIYLNFVQKLMTSSLFRFYDVIFILCIATPKTSDFFNFHQIKLKFGLGVDFKIQFKNSIKCQDLTKKASFLQFWSSTVSVDGNHGSKGTSMLKLLFLKDSLYMYDYSHNIW